ncbi:MAG TPA: hypothetical protein VFA07_07625 [Chthonomonadaceae bacterium]|nr:hypothetical protein [Chthonomonadaceae bacterium]
MERDFISESAVDTLESGFTLDDVNRIAEAIKNQLPMWSLNDEVLTFTDCSWKPQLAGKQAICHVQCSPTIGYAYGKRIQAAIREGYKVSVTAPDELWRNGTLLEQGYALGIMPIFASIRSKQIKIRSFKSIPELIAKERLVLDTDLLEKLLLDAHQRAVTVESRYDKGLRFEELLLIIFSQVDGFEIHGSRYITKTEEIDIVIKCRRIASKVWPNSPVVIVSAKNEVEPVGIPALNDLLMKIKNRGQMCQMGFLCSAQKLAKKSLDVELLRYSQQGPLVVLIDEECIARIMANVSELNEIIENAVVDASLR